MIARKQVFCGLMSVLSVVIMSLGASPTAAQSPAFPNKPVRMVVPWPAGSTVDIVTRSVTNAISPKLGQPVLVENKLGATGNLGAEFVANSPADGYTLLSMASVYVMAKALQGKPFDLKSEWVPVGNMGTSLTFFAVNPKHYPNVHTFQEFLAQARANPKNVIAYGSSGVGSSTHLAMVLIDKRFNLTTNHIPYKGMLPAAVDFIAGRLSAMVIDYGSSAVHVKSGAIVPLMLLLPQRFPELPDVPTARELGYPELESIVTFGVVAPRGTPLPVVNRLAGVIKEAMAESAVQEGIRKTGAGVSYMEPAPYGASLDELYAKWSKVIKDNNIKAEE